VLGLGGVGMFGGFLAFKFSAHVHERVMRFIDPDSSGGMVDTFQVDTALQSLANGGWFGRGPGEGVYKRILPDAHTDMVFSVIGEEFGLIACLGLITFFALIVLRGLYLASRNQDTFSRFAAAGLTVMFGVQSWINMAVNVRAMPAKGMTLPFISYGGSSLLALGIGMGFLIALTRRHLTITRDSHALGLN
jgi:cell division protein FtsW